MNLFFKNHGLSIILLIVITFFIYSHTLYYPFHYDDDQVIVKNNSIRELSNFNKIFSDNPSRILLTFSFALNYYFGKLNLFGYHLVNISLHIINAITIYFILYNILMNFNVYASSIVYSLSLLPALVFSFHPVTVESVTYISSRSGVLCTAFYLFYFL